MSWLFSLIPTQSLYDIVNSKSTKGKLIWVSPVDALVALAYKRFRPGAKLRLDQFRISNDHSHTITAGDHKFDLQSVKRTFLGGKSADLFNLKNPIYHAGLFLELLPKEKRELLLNLALQSVDNMIETTYSRDPVAQECLHILKSILTCALSCSVTKGLIIQEDSKNNEDTESISNTYKLEEKKYRDMESQFRISEGYTQNPLTVKNIEIWKSHHSWLSDIADELDKAYETSKQGGDFEANLTNIRTILDKVREEMVSYNDTILKGQ